MADSKNQHFVPRVYLKSWTTDGELFSLPLKNGITRKQGVKTLTRKENLYTLPSDLFTDKNEVNRELQELISEKIVLKIWEDRWPSVLEAFDRDENTNHVLHTIKGFVIVQSFRTPKFLRSNHEKIERMGKKSEDIIDAYHVALLGIKGLTEYIKNCVCDVFRSVEPVNFLTSDNPATHWLQEGEIYHHLNGIALNDDLYRNPNYKILCPLHPKFFAILTPNLGIDISEEIKNRVYMRNVHLDTMRQMNQMVIHGADKVVYAKNLNDFI